MVNTTFPVVSADAIMVSKKVGTKFPHIPQWYARIPLRTYKGESKLHLPASVISTLCVYAKVKGLIHLLAEHQKGFGSTQIFNPLEPK